MLNIHSFLHRIKKSITNDREELLKYSLMVAVYTMAAIILVISSNGFYGHNKSVIEAYAKTARVSVGLIKAGEETAKEANIRIDYKPINILEEEKIASLVKKQEQEKRDIVRKQQEIQKKKKIEENKKHKQKKLKKTVLPNAQKQVLQRIVEAEATGEDLKGRILVANVILNRVKDKRFPNTVKEVVFQKNGSCVQFSPTKDGRYWSVTVSERSRQAVEKALSGVDYSQGALYFSARSKADKNSMRWFDRHLKWLFKHGGHEFYK